jgi:ribosome recycling factor
MEGGHDERSPRNGQAGDGRHGRRLEEGPGTRADRTGEHALLDGLFVEYYGARTPLNQVAQVNAPEASLLVIQPYDKTALTAIERAIHTSDLGLTPQNDGKIIRVPVPPLTEERRKELV